jgi:tetratricopeptide (TPR) repeat protein
VFWRRRPTTRTELVEVADRARSRGRLKRAIAGYRAALEIAPGDLAIHAKLAPLLARRGDKAGAIESFALAADGQHKAGFIDRAISLRRQAAETFPEEFPLWLELTRLHLLRNRRADAVAALRFGGRRLLRSRHQEVGVQVLRLALEVEPRDVAAALLLARLLARCGRRPEALTLLDELDPRAVGALRRRARRLAFRLSPTPRRLWRWAKASLGRR